MHKKTDRHHNPGKLTQKQSMSYEYKLRAVFTNNLNLPLGVPLNGTKSS